MTGILDIPFEVPILEFRKDLYSRELQDIGQYLSTLEGDHAWTTQEFSKFRKKSYKYFLEGGYLWRKGKRKGLEPLRVVGDEECRKKILEECHDIVAAGHKGIQSTYERVIALYWWSGVYSQVQEYVQSFFVYQVYSKLRHKDGLTPTCLESLHFQWG